MFEKLKNHSKARIDYYHDRKEEYDDFYKWYITYLNWLYDELEEVKDEIKKDNQVYLEDELWDILWDYLCMLHSMEKEGYISGVDKVLERSYKKYFERIWEDWKNRWAWKDIKEKQKNS